MDRTRALSALASQLGYAARRFRAVNDVQSDHVRFLGPILDVLDDLGAQLRAFAVTGVQTSVAGAQVSLLQALASRSAVNGDFSVLSDGSTGYDAPESDHPKSTTSLSGHTWKFCDTVVFPATSSQSQISTSILTGFQLVNEPIVIFKACRQANCPHSFDTTTVDQSLLA